jgi:hypothetical protein
VLRPIGRPALTVEVLLDRWRHGLETFLGRRLSVLVSGEDGQGTDADALVLNHHDCALRQLGLDVVELRQQRLRLLDGSPSDLTVEQHQRGKRRPAACDNLTEVRISGHDDPALVHREIEDRLVGSIKPEYVTDVNGLVSAVCQGLHHHR